MTEITKIDSIKYWWGCRIIGTLMHCWWEWKLIQSFWKIGLALSSKVDLIMWTYRWNLLSLSVDISGTCHISLAHLWFQPQLWWMVPSLLLLLVWHLKCIPHIFPYSASKSSPVSELARLASTATESRAVSSPGDNHQPKEMEPFFRWFILGGILNASLRFWQKWDPQ